MPEIISRAEAKARGTRGLFIGRAVKITLASCRICSADYRKLGNDLTCSPACRDALYEARWRAKSRLKAERHFPDVMKKSCAQCRVSFVTVNRHQKFCRKDCQEAYWIEQACMKQKKKAAQREPVRLQCKICDLPFDRRQPGHCYCTPACARTASVIRKREQHGTAPEKCCKVCGKLFPTRGPAKTCSVECSAINKTRSKAACRRSAEYIVRKNQRRRTINLSPEQKAKRKEAKRKLMQRYRNAFNALRELGIQI